LVLLQIGYLGGTFGHAGYEARLNAPRDLIGGSSLAGHARTEERIDRHVSVARRRELRSVSNAPQWARLLLFHRKRHTLLKTFREWLPHLAYSQ
jgi:hypothetical protein